jgi:hypothetical protein
MKKKSAILSSLLLALVIVGLLIYFKDTTAPVVSITPDPGPVSNQRPLTLVLEDAGSGLKSVRVVASQGEKVREIFSKTYEPGTNAAQETVTLGAELSDGPLQIVVTAVDYSIYSFGRGNKTEKTLSYTLDTRPPVISLVTNTHNINQGGGALILYRLDEEVERTGVQVGEFFFPGHRLEDNLYASIFAFPWSMKREDFTPRLLAVDLAGNERQSGFNFHANARTFPRDTINITDSFLNTKMPEFESFFPGEKSQLDLFLRVNRELREKNVRALEDIGRKTASRPLWEGPFHRQLGATRGLFAQGRTYFYQGREIDRATHLGIDIAGLAQMPISAANRGTVVFADYLGIYGNCVIIDHGLGLQSLYSHLSQMSVAVGDQVKTGQEIGRSGTSGMAGGDHLHFGMLIAGLEVAPLEWWDPSWLRNNINSKLELIPGGAGR